MVSRRRVLAAISALAASAPARSWAQAGPGPGSSPALRGDRLVLLGTGGGPAPRARRAQPANLLVVDGRPYLFDCGDGTVRQLKRAGVELNDVDQVFLTHLHFDHVAGLAALIGFDWSAGRRRPLELYGPPGVAALADGALQYLAIPEALYAAEMPPHPAMRDLVRAHDLAAGGKTLVYQDELIRVFAAENSHYSTPAIRAQQPQAKSYAYRVETPYRVIVFTGDTGPSQAVIDLARGADILVSEVIDLDAVSAVMRAGGPAGPAPTPAQLAPVMAHMRLEHLAPEEVGKIAAAAGVKMVVLTHLVPGLDSERDTLSYTRGVRSVFAGPVVAGQDLDQF